MNPRLDEILLELRQLEAELLAEVRTREEKFRYEIRQRKVHFTAEAKAQHKNLAKKIHFYLRDARWLSILTGPVIWSCAVPILLLDLWATVYQFICFPIYGIPKVNRSEFVVMDRSKLAYLNGIGSRHPGGCHVAVAASGNVYRGEPGSLIQVSLIQVLQPRSIFSWTRGALFQ